MGGVGQFVLNRIIRVSKVDTREEGMGLGHSSKEASVAGVEGARGPGHDWRQIRARKVREGAL